jgi:hypothetical protein
MNREQVRNPHLIYPGDIIVLDRADGQWRLSLERPATRLSPTVRSSPLDTEAIRSIPAGEIEPYLTRPLITGPGGLTGAAEVVAGRDARAVRGEGDIVYVVGMDPAGGDQWNIYRQGRTFMSADGKEVLGVEQRFLGTAKVERFGDVSTVRIVTAREEIVVGDLLVPAPRETIVNYVPHAPDRPVNGRILQLERDSVEAGRGWLVTLDKGKADGIDVGTVLAISRVLPPIPDPRPSKEPDRIIRFLEQTKVYQPERFLDLPPERSGLLFVYRVFDTVSFAILLNTTEPVSVGDVIHNP